MAAACSKTQKHCVLLCGLPGSGKSTLAGEFVRQYREERGGCSVVLVAFDDHLAAEADWDETTFGAARSASLRAVEAALADESVTVVVVDDIMHLKSMRRQVYVLGRQRNVPVVVVTSNVELSTALARNALRTSPHRVEDAAILRIHSHFEPPGSNTADRLHFTLDSSGGGGGGGGAEQVHRVIERLPPLLTQRASELQALTAATEAAAAASSLSLDDPNRLQQIDLLLRSEASRIMQALPPTLAPADKRRVAAALSTAKQQALASARLPSPARKGDEALKEVLQRAAIEATEDNRLTRSILPES